MPLLPIERKCNQRCLFCSAAGRSDRVARAAIYEELDHMAALGNRTVTLSGGETTLAPHLREVTLRARRKGMAVEVQTNALTSAYPRRAVELAALGISLFNVNFPSHKPAVNDRLTGTSGTLPIRVKGVRNLIACGARVRLTHLIVSMNYRDLPGFASFIIRTFTGLDHVQFSFVKLQGSAAGAPRLLPGYPAAAPFLRKALSALERHGVRAAVDHIPPCFLGRFAGRHVDCLKLSVGEEAVESRIEKKKLPACAGCALGDRCFGPRIDHVKAMEACQLVKPVKRGGPAHLWRT